MLVILLAVAARLARDSRSRQRAIMLVILLAAAAGLAREFRARIVAWDKRQNLRHQRKLKTAR